MEVARSFWHRYGGYLPLDSSSANTSLSSSPSSFINQHDSREHSPHPTSPRSTDARPIISWRTQPKAEIVVNWMSIRRQIGPALVALLPSFVVTPKNKKPRKMVPTSYLDGLRGVAAFFVVIHHHCIAMTTYSQYGWGYTGDAKIDNIKVNPNWFWLLPFVRVVHSGRFMVVIFFVLSGYVLSYRSLKLARQGKQLELLDSLASSVFRRWLRLHLPVIASCFLAFVLGRWNAWHDLPKGWEHDPAGVSHLVLRPDPLQSRKGTFFAQLYDWFLDSKQLTNPFLFGSRNISKYNIGTMWTIPLEWMGSMITFITVIGICRTKTWVKLSVVCLLYYRAHQFAKWEWASFFAGIFLAELSFIWARPLEPPIPAPSSPSLSATDPEKELSRPSIRGYRYLVYNGFFVFLFLVALFLGGHPPFGWDSTPGYRWLYAHVPSSYTEGGAERDSFWPSVGAIFLVFALEMAPFLQRIFTTSIAQYLGDISFALYMTHMQVLCTLGQYLLPRTMNITGGWANGQLGFVGGVLLMQIFVAPVTFWLADVFSRLVDEKAVKFARWVSVKAFVKI